MEEDGEGELQWKERKAGDSSASEEVGPSGTPSPGAAAAAVEAAHKVAVVRAAAVAEGAALAVADVERRHRTSSLTLIGGWR